MAWLEWRRWAQGLLPCEQGTQQLSIEPNAAVRAYFVRENGNRNPEERDGINAASQIGSRGSPDDSDPAERDSARQNAPRPMLPAAHGKFFSDARV